MGVSHHDVDFTAETIQSAKCLVFALDKKPVNSGGGGEEPPTKKRKKEKKQKTEKKNNKDGIGTNK